MKMRSVSPTSSTGKDSHSIRVLLHDGLLTLHNLVHLRWLRITLCSMFHFVGPRVPTGSDNLLAKGYSKDGGLMFYLTPTCSTKSDERSQSLLYSGPYSPVIPLSVGGKKTYSAITGALLGFDSTVYPRKTIKTVHLRLLSANLKSASVSVSF